MDMLFEAYKKTERKSNHKAHRLMEWLRDKKPNDGEKPGKKRCATVLYSTFRNLRKNRYELLR